jgi:hypothetical protein
VSDAIVLLTGKPLTDAERAAIGADGFLPKPFDPITLAADIGRELDWEPEKQPEA